MYSGFADQVAVDSEQLITALDVVVPIQIALGELFCRNVSPACLPAQLLHIELLDAEGTRARALVSIGSEATQGELGLRVVRATEREPEHWSVEEPSLRGFAATCSSSGARP